MSHETQEGCWTRILSGLSRGSFNGLTPVERKPFVAASQGNAIAIFLGEHGDRLWRVVEKSDFEAYHTWFSYYKQHGFDKTSRLEMKGNIKDRAESSSYVFALILEFCTGS